MAEGANRAAAAIIQRDDGECVLDRVLKSWLLRIYHACLLPMPHPRASLYHSLVFLLLLIAATDALHFYLDANEKRCFIEELPTDTVVEGTLSSSRTLR
jgi:hypothetical protein